MMFAQLPTISESPATLDLLDLGVNLALVLLLGHLLGWHFVRYGQVLSNKRKLARVMVFISATTLLIISVVKVSLALSLGLVGALSIIRFRTPIKEPEELAYLFLAIAIGVGFGADRGWETVLVFVVVLAAMALRSGVGAGTVPLASVLQVSAPVTATARPELSVLLTAIEPHCLQVDLRRVDSGDDEFHASLFVELAGTDRLQGLLDSVRSAVPGATVSLVDRNGLE